MSDIDYGHDLLFGSFLSPVARPAQQAVELTVLSEQVGLDLVTFQDHPYQPTFHDTWTLLAFAAARTNRIHLSGNVLNLPLRPPAMLAKSAASLDLLSGGRFELGIGAGAFLDGVAAMGGPRLTAGASVEALAEGIEIIRSAWAQQRVNFDGKHHRVLGFRSGPAPAHPIGIWVGAYHPRMLRLTGRLADGWLPSLQYIEGGVASLPELNARIDQAALEAGREPSAVRRMLNVPGRFSANRGGLLVGPPAQWAEELTEMALRHGISAFLAMNDDPRFLQTFAAEVAPAVREQVAKARATASSSG